MKGLSGSGGSISVSWNDWKLDWAQPKEGDRSVWRSSVNTSPSDFWLFDSFVNEILSKFALQLSRRALTRVGKFGMESDDEMRSEYYWSFDAFFDLNSLAQVFQRRYVELTILNFLVYFDVVLLAYVIILTALWGSFSVFWYSKYTN